MTNDFSRHKEDEATMPKHEYNGPYTGRHLDRIAYPIGAIDVEHIQV